MNHRPMMRMSLRAAVSALLLSGGSGATAIAAKAPTMEDLWKVIQQQQKEIEALKSKLGQTETQQQEVKREVEQIKSASESAPAPDQAQAKTESKAKSEAERKTDMLAAEVEKLKTILLIPEKREYKSMYGLGPAASQVYLIKRGLSLGGYGEAFYTNYQNDNVEDDLRQRSTVDLRRLVLYAGYKFNDWIILNNEIEFEHGTTGVGAEERGRVSIEFSQLDFLFHEKANVRTGLMLVPMGFINEIHEPLSFHGNRRPQVEQTIIPTTWREMGVGVHGELIPGFMYRAYVMNGLNAEGFGPGGIRGGRQSGSNALAEDLAFTARFDYMPPELPGLLVGASTWLGNSGQGTKFETASGALSKPGVFTQLYEGHLQWYYRGFEFRALGAWGGINDANVLSEASGETVGSSNYGWYVESAYDVLPWIWKGTTQYLAPFVRYERYNTLATVPEGFTDYDGLYNRMIYQFGLTYKPITNIVVKADYRNISSAAGQLPAEFNLGIGFIF